MFCFFIKNTAEIYTYKELDDIKRLMDLKRLSATVIISYDKQKNKFNYNYFKVKMATVDFLIPIFYVLSSISMIVLAAVRDLFVRLWEVNYSQDVSELAIACTLVVTGIDRYMTIILLLKQRVILQFLERSFSFHCILLLFVDKLIEIRNYCCEIQ